MDIKEAAADMLLHSIGIGATLEAAREDSGITSQQMELGALTYFIIGGLTRGIEQGDMEGILREVARLYIGAMDAGVMPDCRPDAEPTDD